MNTQDNEELNSVHDLGKYQRKLKKCRDYLQKIKSGYMTDSLFDEMKKFSLNTYKELYVDNPIVAVLNTCLVQRNVTPIEQLKLNLEALEKMLVEVITKEGAT